MGIGYLVTRVARRKEKQEGRESWRRKDKRGRDGGEGRERVEREGERLILILSVSDSWRTWVQNMLFSDSLQIARDTLFSPPFFCFFVSSKMSSEVCEHINS